ncbi:MAG TPA: c-type cytochrome biogenesis protein CcsB [Frankiaceae bacterium]
MNQTWGHLSDQFFLGAVVLYAVALLGYAAEFAFRRDTVRPVRRAAVPAQAQPVQAAAKVLVTAGGGGTVEVETPFAVAPGGPDAPPPTRGVSGGSLPGRMAVAATFVGWGFHVACMVTRALAAHRVPWGNMYEFATMIALVAVTAYLVLLIRQPVRYLGAFVMLPVVCYLGLAGTVLYAQAGPLVPALNSYWIKIHVVAAILASGTFIVSAVSTGLYLVKERAERRAAAGLTTRTAAVTAWLPDSAALDRNSYRVAAFAFPIWTFAIIAGAIWAEAAWGRYWGWDPKETWSFITWVVYAGYLHARATAGWKGRKAALIGLLAFGCLIFDFFGVNMWITGLHSYAGL